MLSIDIILKGPNLHKRLTIIRLVTKTKGKHISLGPPRTIRLGNWRGSDMSSLHQQFFFSWKYSIPYFRIFFSNDWEVIPSVIRHNAFCNRRYIQPWWYDKRPYILKVRIICQRLCLKPNNIIEDLDTLRKNSTLFGTYCINNVIEIHGFGVIRLNNTTIIIIKHTVNHK